MMRIILIYVETIRYNCDNYNYERKIITIQANYFYTNFLFLFSTLVDVIIMYTIC